MKVKVVAFGIAKDILGTSKSDIELDGEKTIHSLKGKLVATYPKFGELARLSFAVNEEYRTDEFTLDENDEVVLIPPVSGG